MNSIETVPGNASNLESHMHKIVITPLFFFLTACSTLVLQSPSSTTPVVLGGSQHRCTLKTQQKEWSLLFGIYPVKKVVLDESVLKADRAYRISESYSWKDVLISIVGGSLATLHVKSISVEECDERFVIRTPEEIQKEEEQILQAGLDLYMKLSADENEAVLLLQSGETKIGRIESLDAKNVILVSRRVSVPSDPVDRVVLRGGKVLRGKVLRQSKDDIVMWTKSGLQKIDKKKIQTIVYFRANAANQTKPVQDARKAAEAEDVERIMIPRSQIKRIVLRPANDENAREQAKPAPATEEESP